MVNIFSVHLGHAVSTVLKKPFVFGLPYTATIEPTNRCNLKCAECPAPQNQLSDLTGYISVNDFEKVVTKISGTVFYVMLYFQGEPFMHRELTQLITLAKGQKMYVITSTNGHFLNEKACRDIIISGLDQLIISIDGTSQKSYETYRKGGNLQVVKKNLSSLVNQKREYKTRHPFITVQFLVTSQNEHEMEEIKRWKKEIGFDEIRFKSIQIYDLSKGNHLLPAKESYRRYKKRSNGTWEQKQKIRNCSRIWNTIVMNHKMQVLPCCYDKNSKYPMGNLNDEALNVIWKKKTFHSFRKQVIRQSSRIEICNNCVG